MKYSSIKLAEGYIVKIAGFADYKTMAYKLINNLKPNNLSENYLKWYRKSRSFNNGRYTSAKTGIGNAAIENFTEGDLNRLGNAAYGAGVGGAALAGAYIGRKIKQNMTQPDVQVVYANTDYNNAGY